MFGVNLIGATAALIAFNGTFTIGGGTMVGITAYYWYQGLYDMRQHTHAIKRNFPVLGNFRYILEVLRPEIRQYFIEADREALPFSRADRSVVYQRAKGVPDSEAFGTKTDLYQNGFTWINHSMFPVHIKEENRRIPIGQYNTLCTQPYSAAILNVSGMSYGALSDNAILALNTGAQLGGFYHNTGEGGISEFHTRPGGDLVWNVGTGYFGCRGKDGKFSPEQFAERATQPQVKMIELKLSQGAKPAHGGVLPKAKITPAIAHARGVGMDKDVNSPPRHSAFSNYYELIEFLMVLQELSGGKPVGFKLCVGRHSEFMCIVKAMLEVGFVPDFITVDGAEGGTGAAPPEFQNFVGMPLVDGLRFVDNALRGAGIRDQTKIICAGKIIHGYDIVEKLALGADLCNAARAMMFSLGCIQSLKCNTNQCPTGIATQDRELMRGLDVENKGVRVYNYQKATVEAAFELMGAMGIHHPDDLMPDMISCRKDQKHDTLDHMYPTVPKGCLLDGTGPTRLQKSWVEGKAKMVFHGRSIM